MKCLNISHPTINKYLDIVKSEVALSKILDVFPEDYFPSEEQVIEEWNKNYIESLQNKGLLSKKKFYLEGDKVFISIPKEFREQDAIIGKFPIPQSKDYNTLDELEYTLAKANKDWISVKESEKALYVVIPKKFHRPSSTVKLKKAEKLNNDEKLSLYYTEEEIQSRRELFNEPFIKGTPIKQTVQNISDKKTIQFEDSKNKTSEYFVEGRILPVIPKKIQEIGKDIINRCNFG